MNNDPSTCPNERLNTVIAIGLLVVLVVCLVIYAVVYIVKGQPDGQLVQLGGTIAGGLVGFLARTLMQHGAVAGSVDNLTVNEATETGKEAGD